MLPTTTTLSPEDRTKLSTLFRTRGDAVSFAHLREEDPLDTLLWLDQPHIKPWHDAIRAAHREHEQTETHLSLARALKDITRILDLEADSKLRIRAINAIIRLANAIHRANPRATDRGAPAAGASANRVRTATELHRAQENAEVANYRLNTHLERRANRNLDLQDATAPIGTRPSWAPPPSSPLKGADDGCQGSRGPASAPLVTGRMIPQHPSGVHEAPGNHTRRFAPPALNGRHANGTHSTRAGTPRPPSDQRRRPPRKRRR